MASRSSAWSVAITLAALAGCAGQKQAESKQAESSEEPIRIPAQEEPATAMEAPVREDVAGAEHGPILPSDVVERTATGERPWWWFDAPRHENNQIMVAAEGLAPSLVLARRHAIEAGTRMLEEERGSPVPFIQYIRTNVSQDPGGGYRVHVLLACDE